MGEPKQSKGLGTWLLIPWWKWQRTRHLRLGRRGERLSTAMLREIGLDVLCRNYRNAYGEIDIVALEKEVLCFIEVKTRRHQELGRPADAVDTRRRNRYRRAAAKYMSLLGAPDTLDFRFDIVEVDVRGWRVAEIRYVRNAF